MSKPILSVVGKKNSGKTTFLEKLVPLLVAKGHKVGILKHDVHGFEMDHPGKDTYRLRQAGAMEVAIASDQQFALVKTLDRELSVEEVVRRYFWDADLILTEGYKTGRWPKVEVTQGRANSDLICKKDDGLLAVVAHEKFSYEVPVFAWEEVSRVAEFIVNELKSTASFRQTIKP